MSELYETYYQSPIGWLRIRGTPVSVNELAFTELTTRPHSEQHECLQECCRQLDEYFARRRRHFDLPLAPQGTPFQQSVWGQLMRIPYGTTSTYLEVARALGKEKAIRAVGAANGRNPIPILIPCHRVIGSNGRLIGFGGGIWRKEFLLNLEQALLC